MIKRDCGTCEEVEECPEVQKMKELYLKIEEVCKNKSDNIGVEVNVILRECWKDRILH